MVLRSELPLSLTYTQVRARGGIRARAGFGRAATGHLHSAKNFTRLPSNVLTVMDTFQPLSKIGVHSALWQYAEVHSRCLLACHAASNSE